MRDWVNVTFVDEKGTGATFEGSIRESEVQAYVVAIDPDGQEVVKNAKTAILLSGREEAAVVTESKEELDKLFGNVTGEQLA